MKQETKFGRGTTLNQALKELEENGCTEITRIMFKGGWIFQYLIK